MEADADGIRIQGIYKDLQEQNRQHMDKVTAEWICIPNSKTKQEGKQEAVLSMWCMP